MQNGKNNGFTGRKIQKYFSYRTVYNTGEMLAFKKQAFPDWATDKDKNFKEKVSKAIE